ncbi:MAG: TerB family tellurite resistance protein [Rhodospirillales bacterium]|nr:TerB family tellurite resistance protein [Rhodospirillales bacterium]
MFLHLLDRKQKDAFLVLAQRISMIDGEDDLSERDALIDLKSRLGATANPDMTAVLAEPDLSAFTTRKVRVIAMLELLTMAYADGYLHDAESGMISDLSAAFGFDQSDLNSLAAWAMEAIALSRKGESLMGR